MRYYGRRYTQIGMLLLIAVMLSLLLALQLWAAPVPEVATVFDKSASILDILTHHCRIEVI